jgi:hypothetical protein
MAKRYRIIQAGLGPVGQAIARLALQRENLQVLAAVDPDPAKVGKDLGTVLGLERTLGITVQAGLPGVEADAVIQATGSHLKNVSGQLEQYLTAGYNVVSTCEELSFPVAWDGALARWLDSTAKSHNVTIHGTGVNPGFVMDALVLCASGACQAVRSVKVTRVVDARHRRLPLQQKTGATLSPEEFMARARAGNLGHVGLEASCRLVAAGLGWPVEDYSETIEPVVAGSEVSSQYLTVKPGQVAGLHQTATLTSGGKSVIVMDLTMALGADNPHDQIEMDSDPPVNIIVQGGYHGDKSTAAVIVNSIPMVVEAQPGLLTVADLAIPRAPGSR